jgi:hypothetical protein
MIPRIGSEYAARKKAPVIGSTSERAKKIAENEIAIAPTRAAPRVRAEGVAALYRDVLIKPG